MPIKSLIRQLVSIFSRAADTKGRPSKENPVPRRIWETAKPTTDIEKILAASHASYLRAEAWEKQMNNPYPPYTKD